MALPLLPSRTESPWTSRLRWPVDVPGSVDPEGERGTKCRGRAHSDHGTLPTPARRPDPRFELDPIGPATIEPSVEAVCWSRLRAGDNGLLSYAGPHGPVSLAVSYLLDHDEVVIPMADFNEACRFVPGSEVVLELNGREADDRWLVRLTGSGRLDPAAPDPGRTRLRLQTRRVRGYVATSLST